MKKLLLLFSAALTMLFVGCTQFDDTRIWDAIDELEDLFDDLDNRVEDLEEACEKMNTNIEALQTLVAALQANDTITAIAPIKQGDKVVGYTISFSKSEPITIYHGNDGKDGADGEDGKDGENGADGEDGYTPQIGIAKDSDNVYYWTLDGEWLLDENGNKIKAVGTDGKDGEDGEDGANGQDGADGEDGKDGENGADGKDGITPQLEIRDGYWYISYDNGATWKELGKATGEDGKDGADGEDGKDGEDGTNGADGQDGKDGDSLFQSVTWDEEYAYFTLSDGTVIKIPLASDSEAEEGDLPPANEIWYTSTDGEVVTPFWEIDEEGNSVFNANIISNTYENGKGVITFDSDVTSIGYGAFAMRTNLKSIIIPNRVTVIGVSALAYNKTLTSVILPESLTFIGEDAFCGCSSLETITIPNSVVEIESYAFGECISLPIEDNVRYADTYAVEVIDDTLTTYSLKEGTRLVNEGLFRFCENLTSVILPESLTCIGKEMFSNCSNLENVVIPNSVTAIKNDAFSWCVNLTNITIPEGVTHIGYRAFSNCKSLTKIYIPESVTFIGGGVFNYCENLAEIKGKYTSQDNRALVIDGAFVSFARAGLTQYNIPEGVTIIEDDVFHGCSNLTNIAIPNSVTSIGEYAFADCKSLASVIIPDSVTSIGNNAFEYCSSLASVSIGNGVTSIEYYVFADCKSLAEVYCKPTTPPTGGPDMFAYLDENWDIKPIGCMIYVPTESVDAYKAADYWCDYADYIEPYQF